MKKPHASPLKEIDRFWTRHYFNGESLIENEKLSLYLNEDLSEEERLTILTSAQGGVRVCLTSKVAAELGVSEASEIQDVEAFKELLCSGQIELHSADRIYYADKPLREPCERENSLFESTLFESSLLKSIELRPLSMSDGPVFSKFEAGIDPMELDNAWVELDHWMVLGVFFKGQLAAACSLYPWQNSSLADMGVVTSPSFRRQGLAKILVQYAQQEASKQGYLLQYRTQIDNLPSIKLAESLGLLYYGIWEPTAEEEG